MIGISIGSRVLRLVLALGVGLCDWYGYWKSDFEIGIGIGNQTLRWI